ncbi:hypothetical protein K435DRAFT_670369 [Dendrothele bispora CBS 962.96]|uniref:T6SS Phospholipase effector Tle1-like catalytic domain-containing protein n=1 Tax=Dendrothele bispora (strain CBS 962.96) TaxID=1314807 RepID=A0A4S8LW42_DENBC|nr:hypothetical protein K435DRAFT_670369 [Dendrothele bispora CBS 962.96]
MGQDDGGKTTEAGRPDGSASNRKNNTKCGCKCDLGCGCNCICSRHCLCRDPCEKDCPKGRNLIVSIDGTSNQFGSNNTNVVELHSRVDTDDQTQLKCYLSGIGTVLPPSPWAVSHWKVRVACKRCIFFFAISNEELISISDRWLMDHYRPGDRIFLFAHHDTILDGLHAGFSRGAYQVRTLAGIIHTLGLLEAGNKAMIPYAYDLYTGNYQQIIRKYIPGNNDIETKEMIANFKKTFCHKDVQVHFVGVWDTVSSIGVVRQMPLPLTTRTDHVCFFRHALALDERRVKFIPEYLMADSKGTDKPRSQRPHTDSKEVWFAGTHSDM